MTCHYWGDEWFEKYGNDLNQAILYIYDEMKSRAGLHIILKEKYGTIRWEYEYSLFWPGEWPIFNYFYPGYMFYGWPRWIMKYIEYPLSNFLCKIGYTKRKHTKQVFILKQVVFDAVSKWPHLRAEILPDFVVHEKIFGKELHDEFWTKWGDET